MQSPWPGTGVPNRKSLEVLPEVLPGVLWEIGVLWGVPPRVRVLLRVPNVRGST